MEHYSGLALSVPDMQKIGLTQQQIDEAQSYFRDLPEHLRASIAGLSALSAVVHIMKNYGTPEQEAVKLAAALLNAMCPDDRLLAAAEFHSARMHELLTPNRKETSNERQ